VPDVQYPDDSRSNSPIRIEEILTGDEETPSAPPVREGLPRTFRMRADKHYVEMLDTLPQRSTDAEAASATSRQSDTSRGDIDAGLEASIAAGRDLAQSLATLRTSTNLLTDGGPALAATVAANLIRAEAWRATCLLKVAQFLRGELTPTLRIVRARAIAEQVIASIEPERRLRGVTLDAQMDVGESVLSADGDLLVTALSGVLMATMALAPDPSEFVVVFSAETRGAEVIFTIAQDQARVPSNWISEAVGAAAERIITSSKGRLAIATSTGSEVRATVPRLT